MLEKFTAEEIKVLRKELKDYDRKNQKSIFIQDDLQRIEDAFDREIYSKKYIYPERDIREALTTIADHITANYTLMTRYTKAINDSHWVRATCIPADKEKVYKEAVTRIVDVIIDLKMPYE